MNLNTVHINPDGSGVDIVMLYADGSTHTYKYSGEVRTAIHQHPHGALCLDIAVIPRSESAGHLVPPNAYKG